MNFALLNKIEFVVVRSSRMMYHKTLQPLYQSEFLNGKLQVVKTLLHRSGQSSLSPHRMTKVTE
jgi:hypothetical protein